MDYKLVAMDLDGTLLSDKLKITDRDRQAVKRLLDNDIKLILASGRPMQSMLNYAKQLDIESPLVSSNGALVYDIKEAKINFESLIAAEITKGIIAYAKERDFPLSVYTKEEIVTLNEQMAEGHLEHEGIVAKVADSVSELEQAAVKILFYLKDKALRREVKSYLMQEYKDVLYITQSEAGFFEIMSQQSSKGKAIKHMMEEMQIPVEKTVAIGNNYNDLTMFEVAGLSIATANAPAEVKKRVDYITKDPTDSGVADAVDKFILTRGD